MDQYLNELHMPGAVMHFPPDKPSWNRSNPTKQQLSLIQDATIADMVRMRNIQEARQAEIDAGMGGGYDAGSAAKEGPVAPAVTVPDAPVVTSIESGNTELSAFFAAPASNGGSIITNYKYSIDKGTSFTARSPYSSVSPIKITGLTNGTEYDVRIRAVNTIGDGTVSNALSGTPVAPAPSGIPVASTASVVIAGNVQINGVHTRVPQGTEIMFEEGGEPDTFVLSGGTFLYRRPNFSFSPTTYSNSILFPPNSIIKDGGGSGSAVAGTPFSTWTIGVLYFDSDSGGWFLNLNYASTNPSTDPTIIPTSGWTGYFGNFTITAA